MFRFLSEVRHNGKCGLMPEFRCKHSITICDVVAYEKCLSAATFVRQCGGTQRDRALNCGDDDDLPIVLHANDL
jgi:hypothetical protein